MPNRKRPKEIDILLRVLAEAYDERAWHGTNLHGSIRGMTAKRAAWRPGGERHNVWEVVLHCAYWKYTVRRRLLGEKKGSFPLKGSNWFRRPLLLTDEAWRADVKLLDESHQLLRNAVEAIRPSELKKKPAGITWTILQTISGIASHDLYHAGQIQLLKKLSPKNL